MERHLTGLADNNSPQADNHPTTNNLTFHNEAPGVVEEGQEIWKLQRRMLL